MFSLFSSYFNKGKDDRKPGKIIYKNDQPSNEETIKIKAHVYGVVQGVGFRYSTVHLAKQIGVNGIVKNEMDGSVYVEAIANKEQMDEFIEGLAKGPSPSAQVDKVEIWYDSSITDYNGFGERH